MDEYLEAAVKHAMKRRHLRLATGMKYILKRFRGCGLEDFEIRLLLEYCLKGCYVLAVNDLDEFCLVKFKTEKGIPCDPDADHSVYAHTRIVSVKPAEVKNLCSAAVYWCRKDIQLYSSEADQDRDDDDFDKIKGWQKYAF